MAQTKAVKNELTISSDLFNALIKLKVELEDVIETIEIMNDEELMEGLKRSREDMKAGRVYELSDLDELDEIWK